MKRRTAVAAALLCPGLWGAALGEEWPILGARSMGMGGAGVAAARGGTATYWNPAALARSRGPSSRGGSGRLVNGAGGLSVVVAAPNSTLSDLDRLSRDLDELDLDAVRIKLETGVPLTTDELRRSLRILGTDIPALSEPGKGLLLNAVGGPTLEVGRFGLSLLGTIHAGIRGETDLFNVALGDLGIGGVVGAGQDRSGQLTPAGQSLADQLAGSGSMTQDQAEELVFHAEQGGVNTADPSSRTALSAVAAATAANAGGSDQRSFQNNQSGAVIRGLFIQELALAYGHPLGDWLAVGVAPKAMHAFTYSRRFTVEDLPRSGELAREAVKLNGDEGSLAFGLDAGVLFTPTDWLALGVTGKNLNRPSFEREGGGHLVLDPSARAGVAVVPLSWLTLAADLDLFHYQSEVLPGHRSQVVGGGAEVDLGGIVALRAGISKNLLDAEEDVLLHAGLGLHIWHLSLEAAAMVTPSLQPVNEGENVKIPERAGASLTLEVRIPF